MTPSHETNRRNLDFALDQLTSRPATQRANWHATTRSLEVIEALLSSISLRNDTGGAATSSGEVALPGKDNALYGWFLSLQDTFHSNVASHLVGFIQHMVGVLSSEVEEDEREQGVRWICQSLYLLQGCLLLHAPSRALFSRRAHMTLLVNFLDGECPEEIHMDAIQTLVAALVDRPDNLRTFEDVDGLSSISKLFLHEGTTHRVKVKVLEFLYFYLIPEAAMYDGGTADRGTLDREPRPGATSESAATSRDGTYDGTVRLRQHMREPAEHDETVRRKASGRKTTKEKQVMLGRYFSNIDALVRDLNDFKPFGEF